LAVVLAMLTVIAILGTVGYLMDKPVEREESERDHSMPPS
jgi:hypothetical protein